MSAPRNILRPVCLLAFLFAFETNAFPAETGDPTELELKCIVHIHSDMSSGRYALPELTETAKKYGADVLFLTDGLTQSIQFGAPPLRQIFWASYSKPSIMTLGPKRYLAAIQQENDRQSEVLYIPGAEICPRIFWTGSLARNDLTCHDHQKNILVLGTHDPKFLKKIPECVGYTWRRHPFWILSTRLIVVLLAVLLLGLVTLPRRLAKKTGFPHQRIRLSMLLTLILPVAVAMLLLNILAAQHREFQIYGRGDPADSHDQAIVDYLRKAGLVSLWAHPEAPDHQEFSFAKFGFTAKTDPYPGILLSTSGYTGFGGVSEGQNHLIEPDNVWDRALLEYLRGHRKDPAWCFGEMLYHYEGQARKQLNNVETIVRVAEKSESAILDALRDGHFYSRRNHDGQSLSLKKWKVNNVSGGDTIRARPGKTEIAFEVDSARPGETVEMILVSNGKILEQKTDKTPCALRYTDRDSTGARRYYRVIVKGKYPLKLVTNPIFFFPQEG